MKKLIIVLSLLAICLVSCNDGAMETQNDIDKANPFLGTWEVEVGDKTTPENYASTHALSTIIFATKNEYTYIHQWLEGDKNKKEYHGKYYWDANKHITFFEDGKVKFFAY